MDLSRVLAAMLFLPIFMAGPIIAEVAGETNSEHLAKQLQNPVASLISIPFQNNFESGLGPAKDGNRYTLRVQPVVPATFNKDWNLITRPIFSYINQQNVIGATRQNAISDTQIEMFFTPKTVREGDMLWGLGPVFLLPTAAEASLGTEKWGIGPSACILKQEGHLTIGMLATHLWSIAGNNSRSNISLSYLQPFISHSNNVGTSINFSSETNYDWMNGQATIPLIFGASQIVPMLGHYFSFSLSGIYNLQSSTNTSPWGGRAVVTLLLPEKNK
ncbi:MAG: transporter [Candidatus Margulisiibacteriota bacterium]